MSSLVELEETSQIGKKLLSFDTGTHSGIVQIEKTDILLLPQLKVPI